MNKHSRNAFWHNAEVLSNIADVLKNPDSDMRAMEQMSNNLLEVKKSMDIWIEMEKRGALVDFPDE